MITGGVIIAVIAFFAVGKLTDCTAAELQSRYSAAMAAKDPAKLLKLFPHSQTKSKFAKDGAKQLIKVNYAASSIMSGENQVVRVTSKNWLLFFKKYQLNITPTTVKLAKSAKQHALYYKGKKVSTNDLKAPLFYGSYTFTTTQSSQFGSVKAKASVAGGERKSTTLSFPKSTNYVTIPGGPNTFKVSYKGKATDITLKAKQQKVGSFSQNVDDPASELSISGTYGNTVTVDKANLSDVTGNGSESLPYSDGDTLIYELPNSAVTYDFKNIKTNVDAFAKQYFKANHSGSWSGFTLVTAGFKDNYDLSGDDDSDETDTYKNIDFTQADVQSYLGDDGNLYLYVPFSINYTYKYDDDSDTEDSSSYAGILFKAEQDGKLYGVSDGMY